MRNRRTSKSNEITENVRNPSMLLPCQEEKRSAITMVTLNEDIRTALLENVQREGISTVTK